MALSFDSAQLEKIVEDFYILTGIRISIFDIDYNEVLSYPPNPCEFCKMMKNDPVFKKGCYLSDLHHFEECRRKDGLVIYKCHAGLMEATVPLKEDGVMVGYVMLGQITNQKGRKDFYADILKTCKSYGCDEKLVIKSIKNINYKSQEQIVAASEILEVCTCYFTLKEIVTSKTDMIVNKVNEYIDEHLSESIDIDDICKYVNVSRTALYKAFNKSLQIGIYKYIKTKRLEKAKQLLKQTDRLITDISAEVGFTDNYYFSRVFKQHFGKSPKSYRK